MTNSSRSTATPQAGAASRAAAAQALFAVLEQGQSLSQALPNATQNLSARDKALSQSLCYQVLRALPLYNFILSQLLDKPLKGKLKIVHYLLLVGACQLLSMRTADHAAVSATVDAALNLGRKPQKGLVNGVLRNLQRQQQQLLATATAPEHKHGHPRWLAERLVSAYGASAADIMQQANQQAPLWLRVNLAQQSREQYLAALQAEGIEVAITPADVPSAIALAHAVDVQQLPGFASGAVSVQDLAAQRAAMILAAQPGQRVLDCCAAPGGKTAHIAEYVAAQQPAAGLQLLLALDNDAQRLRRVEENFARIQLPAQIRQADAAQPATWWDQQPFDRILLDAPCSATGVIRRHPDIKWLRRASDIDTLVALQREMLERLWPTLAVGGVLLYATCSILPEENNEQIKAFMAAHPDCQRLDDAVLAGSKQGQYLPGDGGGDGFFYAKLTKTAAA